MALVRAGEIELDVERSGRPEGPPLLLIMGMSGTALHWGEPFLEELRRDFDVIAYDHRGVGASTRLAEGGLTIAAMAEDAAALIEALELDAPMSPASRWAGWSPRSSRSAHPEAVRTLTLGCTYCGGPGSALAGRGRDRAVSSAAMMSGDRARAIRTGWEIERLARVRRP